MENSKLVGTLLGKPVYEATITYDDLKKQFVAMGDLEDLKCSIPVSPELHSAIIEAARRPTPKYKYTVLYDLTYEGKTYPIVNEHTWGADGDETIDDFIHGQRYYYTDGNFGCDCNRADQITYQHDENFPDMECGDKIVLSNLRFVFTGEITDA